MHTAWSHFPCGFAAGDLALLGDDRARDSPALLGAGLQAAGQQLGQASDSLFAIYQRHAQEANDNRVQDLTNRFMDDSRAILKTGPDAYYKLTGADAIKGADATTAKLKSLRDETFGQTANPYQRQRLGPILDAHLAAATAGIVRHTALQQDVYSRRVASDAIATSRVEAKADPSLMPNAVLRAEGAARVVHAGQPPEAVEAGVRGTGGSVIADVIGDRLMHNDPIGVTLLQRYGDRLDPNVRRTLSAAADTLSNSLAAATWVRERSAGLRTPVPTGDAALDAVNAASPPVAGSPLYTEDGIAGSRQRLDEIDARRHALSALNQQEFAANPARLRANRMAIDTDAARSRAAVKADADTVYADLRRHLTTGGPEGGPAVTPPSTLMSRLTDAQQDAVTVQVAANIEGRKPGTDPQTWDAIHQGLTADDAGERQRWASINLVPFMGRLSTEDYAGLEKLQALVRGNDGGAEQRRLQRVTRMANDALQSVGIDPMPRPGAAPDSDAAQAARFHRAVADDLSAFESRGRKPTEAEAHDIVNGVKETGIKSGWLKVNERVAPLEVDSDVPAVDPTVYADGPEFAQAGPEERKPVDAEAEGEFSPEPDSGSTTYRDADREARRIVAGQEIQQVENDRAISRWVAGLRPDAPAPELPKDDVNERLKWAREPLFRYRARLSAADLENLVMIQSNINPSDGVRIESIGYPFGSREEYTELVTALVQSGPLGRAAVVGALARLAALFARQAYRVGRRAWEKIKGEDEPPAGKDAPTNEGLGSIGVDKGAVGGGIAKAAEAVLSASRATSVPSTTEDTTADQPRNFGKNPKDSDVVKGIQEARETARRYREAHPLVDVPDLPGFTSEESRMIAEGRRIYFSPHFTAIREGHVKGEVVVGNIDGQVIQYEPSLPAVIQGMSSEGDVTLGPSALISDLELGCTIGQELYRLRMDQTGWASPEHAANAHEAARGFANRAGPYITRRAP